MISVTLENQAPRRRSALLIAVFVSATLALLVVASAASAGATGGLDPTSPATNSAAPVEQVAETAANTDPVEQAEAPAPSAETQPVETPKAASVPDSTRANVTSVADEPVAAARSNPSVSTRPVDAARSTKAIVDSVSTRTTSVAAAKSGPEAPIASAVKHPVAAVDEGTRQSFGATVEGIRQDLPGTVANVRQDVAEEISALSDRLPRGPAGTSLSSLLNTANPASAAVMPPSAGPPQTGMNSSRDGALSFLGPLQASLFSSWNPIASGGYTNEQLTLSGFGSVEKLGPTSHRPGTLGKISSIATGGAGTGINAATPDSRGPAPLDIPLPSSPKSPEAIAPGSGDAFFVPFAALLALLALVAPVSMRRLREAPDFRAPTPFVCALERPG